MWFHCLRRSSALKEMLPIQPGDVPATYADVEDLMRDVDFGPRQRSRMVSRGLRNGIMTITRFEGWT
jgi:hypothetical protein